MSVTTASELWRLGATELAAAMHDPYVFRVDYSDLGWLPIPVVFTGPTGDPSEAVCCWTRWRSRSGPTSATHDCGRTRRSPPPRRRSSSASGAAQRSGNCIDM